MNPVPPLSRTSETRTQPDEVAVVATSDVPPNAQLIYEWRVIADLESTNAHWESQWRESRDITISMARKWAAKHEQERIKIRIERRVLSVLHVDEHDTFAESDADL